MTEEAEKLSPGELANNGIFVQGLQKLLTGSEYNLEALVCSVKAMVNGCWRAFTFQKCPNQIFRWNAADFRKFIEAERPAGCHTPLYILERQLRGTDAWETYLELTRGEPGGSNNPGGNNQYAGSEVKCDNVTVDHSPPPPTGNSVSYALRRLSRERPDLYERVKAREMTANAAMIEAGFRPRQMTIPMIARMAGRRIARNFTHQEFSELVDAALDYYREGGEV